MSDDLTDCTWTLWEDLQVGDWVGPTSYIEEKLVHESGTRQVLVTGGYLWDVIIGLYVKKQPTNEE